MTHAPVLVSTSFADDVRHFLRLTPRQLPSRYLYDPLGSALFDAICELPWSASLARRAACCPVAGTRFSGLCRV